MRTRISIAIVLFLVTMAVSAQTLGWGMVKAGIRRQFPDVPRITTEELAVWLSDSGKSKPLLLDVRSRPEYDVSHLANARNITPDAPVNVIEGDKEQPIVTYCSVGYRSSEFARKLRRAGFKDVRNLEGSIFAWVNEGRPIFRNGNPVSEVHPYSRTWGSLLKKKYRAKI